MADRFDASRPRRKIHVTETGFSVRARDILKSERAQAIIQNVRDHLVLEKSTQKRQAKHAG